MIVTIAAPFCPVQAPLVKPRRARKCPRCPRLHLGGLPQHLRRPFQRPNVQLALRANGPPRRIRRPPHCIVGLGRGRPPHCIVGLGRGRLPHCIVGLGRGRLPPFLRAVHAAWLRIDAFHAIASPAAAHSAAAAVSAPSAPSGFVQAMQRGRMLRPYAVRTGNARPSAPPPWWPDGRPWPPAAWRKTPWGSAN